MAYTVLARKYRSQTFDEVIGQDHIAQTLKRAIESDRLAHAFLFCGTRGTGKTSMARILAKALNCQAADKPTTQPCGLCESCKGVARGDDIDVIEIDAASNTGVDNVRGIIENSAYRPARSRFKVYIIDEVHMLSKAAFNALLKTLEEPPEHVKFILATTEAEKVLQTILSRCQRYDFRNIPTREIAGHLKEICKSEKIEAEDDALLLVAKAGAGSMRDSLSLLDRLLSIGEKTLTVEMIEQLLGLPKAQLMFDLAQSIGQGDVKNVLNQSTEIITRGLSADSLINSLVDHLRNLLIIRTCGGDSDLVEVPGIPLADLVAQAQKFDAVNLTQDITILEELRRHMRQSQSGRSLLDATLVRLTLAEQFTPVAEILARANAQKKNNPEPLKPQNTSQPPQVILSAAKDLAPSANADNFANPLSNDTSRVELPAAQIPVPPQAPASAAPTVSAPQALTFDDEDDDLPRPGKVWDNTGPSLKELLAIENAKTAAEAPPQAQPAPPDNFNNIEPVAPTEIPDLWKSLLNLMSAHGPGLHSILSTGAFHGIHDDQAIIRFSKKNDTFPKMLERNGKKDLVRQGLSQIMGKPIGVRFEIDQTMEAPAPTAPPQSPSPQMQHRGSQPPPPSRPPAQIEPPGPPAVRITPELIEQMKQDTLVGSLMDKFNAQPVKIE